MNSLREHLFLTVLCELFEGHHYSSSERDVEYIRTRASTVMSQLSASGGGAPDN